MNFGSEWQRPLAYPANLSAKTRQSDGYAVCTGWLAGCGASCRRHTCAENVAVSQVGVALAGLRHALGRLATRALQCSLVLWLSVALLVRPQV